MAATSAMQPSLSPMSSSSVDSVDSEYECELMIEALKRELNAVKSQLAFLTHNLDVSSQPCKQPVTEHSSSPHSPTTLVTKKTKSTDKKHRKITAAESVQTSRDISRYLDLVDKVEDERWELRKRCLQLMQTHIEQQLQSLKEKGELLHRRLCRREKKLKAERLKLKPPRYRSLGTDDTSFLNHLPQSTFYQIVGEEHKLRKMGKLASLTQINEFWEFMLSPTKTPASPPIQKPHPFPLDEADDETSNSWAITALPRGHSRLRMQSPATIPPNVSTSPTTTDVFKFIPGKLPEIKPIAHIFNDEQTELEERREAECMHRVQELTLKRKRLKNSYQQARANEMAMRRLLPQLPAFDHSPILDDVIMTSSPTSDTHTKAGESNKSSNTIEKDRSFATVTADSAETTTIPPLPSTSSSADMNSSSVKHSPLPPVSIPLTMESAYKQSTVVIEPKQKSALWSNYLVVAGKTSHKHTNTIS